MTDDELLQLAARGGNAFYRVHRQYPLKIGVHQSRNSFRKKRLWFSAPPPVYSGPLDFTLERFQHPTSEEYAHTPQVHLVPFVPIFGYAVTKDTIWYFHPDISDWVDALEVIQQDTNNDTYY